MSDPGELSREELLAALAERDVVIAALLAEIEQLKRRVGMDSSNSSMPPGSDGPAEALRSLAHLFPCVLETRRLWAATLDPDESRSGEVLVVLPHMGLTDPLAYVRLVAVVRQQIIDGNYGLVVQHP